MVAITYFTILIGIGYFLGEWWTKPKRAAPEHDQYSEDIKSKINRATVAHFIINFQPYQKKIRTVERNGKWYGYYK